MTLYISSVRTMLGQQGHQHCFNVKTSPVICLRFLADERILCLTPCDTVVQIIGNRFRWNPEGSGSGSILGLDLARVDCGGEWLREVTALEVRHSLSSTLMPCPQAGGAFFGCDLESPTGCDSTEEHAGADLMGGGGSLGKREGVGGKTGHFCRGFCCRKQLFVFYSLYTRGLSNFGAGDLFWVVATCSGVVATLTTSFGPETQNLKVCWFSHIKSKQEQLQQTTSFCKVSLRIKLAFGRII